MQDDQGQIKAGGLCDRALPLNEGLKKNWIELTEALVVAQNEKVP